MTATNQPPAGDAERKNFAWLSSILDDMRTSDKVYAVVGAYNAIVKNILAREQAQREALIAEIEAKAPKNVYTLDEIREKNKHLDSRTQQSALDRSQGIIETNNAWIAALHQLKDPERS